MIPGTPDLLAFVLVASRVGGLFVFAPIFSSHMIPPRIRLVIAAALSLALTPLVAKGHTPPSDDVLELVGLIVKEMLVGLALALAAGAVAYGIQAGASLIDTIIGFSFASTIDPITNLQNAVLGQLYAILVATVLLTTGADKIIIWAIVDSYRIVPLDAYPTVHAVVATALSGFLGIFAIGLALVAPVLIALIVVDGALALVARAVPQVNVFFVGLPAKILIGLATVSASLPFVAGRVEGLLEQSVQSALITLAHG
jgi:flagellar biosynthetic protein FliR